MMRKLFGWCGLVICFMAFSVPVCNCNREAPEDLKAAAIRSTSMSLTWTSESGLNYKILVVQGDEANTNDTESTATSAVSSHIISRTVDGNTLQARTQYSISVFEYFSNNTRTNNSAATITERTGPSRPTNIRRTESTANTITITWEDDDVQVVDEVSQYRITYRVKGASGNTKSVHATTTTATLIALSSNTEYEIIHVVSLTTNNAITSDESVSSEAATVPAKLLPATIVPSTTTTTSISIQWNSIMEGSLEKTYTVNWSPTSADGTTNSQSGIAETEFTITDLVSNTDYSINVVAVSSAGRGEPSVDVSHPTLPATLAPPTIRSQSTTSTITLEWITEAEGSASKTYTITWSPPSADSTTQSKREISSNFVTIDGLTSNTAYSFNLYAVNNAGSGHPSGSASFTTLPKAVRSLNLDSETNPTTKIAVSWNKPAGGDSIQSYEVEWKASSDSTYQSNSVPHTSGENSFAYDVSSLMPGESYAIRVKAKNSAGNGGLTSESILINPDSISSLMIEDTSFNFTTQFKLVWTPPRGIGDNIRLTFAAEPDGVSKMFNVAFAATETIVELSPGFNYSVEVAVYSDFVQSDSSQQSFSSKPFPPIFQAIPTSDKIVLNWTLPDGYYEMIVIQSFQLMDTTSDILTGRETNHTLPNLTPYSNYTIQVYSAIFDVNGILKTSDRTNRTIATLPGAPDLPVSSVTFSSLSSTLSTLISIPAGSFTDKNGPIEYFAVYIKLGGGGSEKPNVEETLNCTQALAFGGECVALWTTGNGSISKGLRESQDNKSNRNQSLQFVIGTNSYSLSPSGEQFFNLQLTPGNSYSVAVAAKTSHPTLVSTNWATIQTREEIEPLNLGWIAAVVAAFLLVVLIVGAFAYRRKNRELKEFTGGELNMTDITTNAHTTSTQPKPIISKIIQLPDFSQHYTQMEANSNLKFKKEYEELESVGKNQPTEAALMAVNRPKNRFTNILPYDKSRVRLTLVGAEPGSDYINANFIPGNNNEKEYVATQGPLPGTKQDFWRLVWEQNSRHIVMLTQPVERGRIKCDHYWPFDRKLVELGDLAIQMNEDNEFPEKITRCFFLTRGKECRTIHQHCYTAWPDHGVPETTESLVRFVRSVRQTVDNSEVDAPLIVHCSAGVGRTGTFITMDRLLQHLEENSYVDIFGIVHQMRMNRVFMVQTESQYILIHQMIRDIANRTYDNASEESEGRIYDEVAPDPPIYENASGPAQAGAEGGYDNQALSLETGTVSYQRNNWETARFNSN